MISNYTGGACPRLFVTRHFTSRWSLEQTPTTAYRLLIRPLQGVFSCSHDKQSYWRGLPPPLRYSPSHFSLVVGANSNNGTLGSNRKLNFRIRRHCSTNNTGIIISQCICYRCAKTFEVM